MNTNLAWLNLWSKGGTIPIGDEGAAALAEALKGNTANNTSN